MSNNPSESTSYQHHHSILSLINKLIENNQLEKKDIIINQLIIKHSDEIRRIKERNSNIPATQESNKKTITTFLKQERKIVEYLTLSQHLEETKEKFNISKYKNYLIDIYNNYKQIKNSLKTMEEKMPCIKSNAQIYNSMQNYKPNKIKNNKSQNQSNK